MMMIPVLISLILPYVYIYIYIYLYTCACVYFLCTKSVFRGSRYTAK
ncbi:unnamed protein product [Brassica oleracea]